MQTGTVEQKIIDDTLPGGLQEKIIIYHAPFDRCDREKDYDTAWKEFYKRLTGDDSREAVWEFLIINCEWLIINC